jgi:hypothetical protein
LSVHHQNIGVLMTHNLEAHVPFPPTGTDSRGRRGAPALNSEWIAVVCPASPPPSSAASATKTRVASRAQQGRKYEDSLQRKAPTQPALGHSS